jgi:hypothetical protein
MQYGAFGIRFVGQSDQLLLQRVPLLTRDEVIAVNIANLSELSAQ